MTSESVRATLLRDVDRLTLCARARGELVRVALGKPCRPGQIEKWETFFRSRMPAELRAHYEAADGFDIRVSSRRRGRDARSYFFALLSIERAIEETIIRIFEFFSAAGSEDEVEVRRFSEGRARELCVIAEFGDSAELCLVDLAKSSDVVAIADTSWEDQDFPENLNYVAASLASFIEQCFENACNGGPGEGFRYFWPPL